MKAVYLVCTFTIACILCNIQPVNASGPLDGSQQLFFNQFRYAVQAHDTGQLIRLTHPRSQECVPEDDRDYYYTRILDSLVRVLGKRQTVQSVSVDEYGPGEMDVSRELPSGESVNWPVVPEARIIIRYERHNRETAASLFLAKDNEKWKWVHICSN